MPRTVSALALFVAVVGLAADDKKDAGLKPIAVADLTRKDPIVYEKDVAPIFAAKCQVCHAGNLTEGKFDLGTHAALLKGGKRGPAVVPGKADDSLLWQMSSHRKKPIMPPKTEDNPLTPELAARAAALVAKSITPIDDVRSTAEYRRHVAGQVVRRLLLDLLAAPPA